ncbi:hypothetical protein IEC97_28505 [Neobacillus cucumis]|uniref:hypothetical protein n=1 Tax=Neobacillus cucumis TaxID=1740721 RepID=UPI0018E00E37|nr:hypothetical protein [Neobacillus cucumis]MBI0581258.1 hypothetical protein [Neobacillus cucumis]
MSIVPQNQAAGRSMSSSIYAGISGKSLVPIVVGAVAHEGNLVNGFYILGFAMVVDTSLPNLLQDDLK